MQAITADIVIAYITHDDRPNISSASSRHGTKRRGGLYIRSMPACITLITLTVILNPNQWTDVCDSSYRGGVSEGGGKYPVLAAAAAAAVAAAAAAAACASGVSW